MPPATFTPAALSSRKLLNSRSACSAESSLYSAAVLPTVAPIPSNPPTATPIHFPYSIILTTTGPSAFPNSLTAPEATRTVGINEAIAPAVTKIDPAVETKSRMGLVNAVMALADTAAPRSPLYTADENVASPLVTPSTAANIPLNPTCVDMLLPCMSKNLVFKSSIGSPR